MTRVLVDQDDLKRVVVALMTQGTDDPYLISAMLRLGTKAIPKPKRWIVKSYGGDKIQAIKEYRAVSGLGLKEAKDWVESLPKVLPEEVARKLDQNVFTVVHR